MNSNNNGDKYSLFRGYCMTMKVICTTKNNEYLDRRLNQLLYRYMRRTGRQLIKKKNSNVKTVF